MAALTDYLAPLLTLRMIPAWICLACWFVAFLGFLGNWADFGRGRWMAYVIAWQFITIFTAAILDPNRGGGA